MLKGRRIDPVARYTVLALAAGRTALGAGALLATAPALRALGFPQPDSSGRALGRLAGGRDVALGLLALAARDDRAALRTAAFAGAAVDLGDALTLGLAAADSETRRAGLTGFASGGAAALTGLWAWRRLNR